MDFIYYWLDLLVQFTDRAGYLGIFIMTFLEGTFLPIPSELTMIPAGYLIYQGELSLLYVIISSILGTLCGALFGYYIAYKFGRGLIIKYGKYFMMDEKKLDFIQSFFQKHGAISTFTGRLVPALRHFISFPAGLARMDVTKFCIYTTMGGGIWMITLTLLGYYIGENEDMIAEYIPIITLVTISVCLLVVAGYIIKIRKNNEPK